MSRCRTCKAPIVWVLTGGGGAMPIDPSPSPQGNLEVDFEADPMPIIRAQFSPTEARPAGQYYQSHFVSCPDAAKHRRR